MEIEIETIIFFRLLNIQKNKKQFLYVEISISGLAAKQIWLVHVMIPVTTDNKYRVDLKKKRRKFIFE